MGMTDLVDDARLALSFLTRLPVTLHHAPADGAMARSMRLFPTIGCLIGLAIGMFYALVHWVLPPLPSAFLAVTAGILLTGALHEDGLADCADGFGGGRDPAAKLIIMKDSRIGSYGGLALILSVALRASALAELAGSVKVIIALIAAHSLSRATLPLAMIWLPAASDRGLAASVGTVAPTNAAQGALSAIIVTALLLHSRAAAGAILAAVAAVWLVGEIARRQIGGYSGDVLGAMQQVAEAAVLLVLLGTA